MSRAPLVSCVMPTFDRREFVPQAIRCFQWQDYPGRELIVVDDGTDPIDDLLPADQRIHYVRLSMRHTVGAKRNIGCEQARGELVVQWDDDDWSAPHRLSFQVDGFLEQDVDVSGLRTLPYVDLTTGDCWRYEYPRDQRPWVFEPTFCFRREFGLARPFPDETLSAGTHWLWTDPEPRIGVLDDSSCYVGVIHGHNTAAKNTRHDWWRPLPRRSLPALFGADLPAPG